MSKRISELTAADVADLGALTSEFEVSIDVTTVPLSRRIGLGKIATWLATIGLAASNVLAQGVTVTQGTIIDPAAGYAQTVTWNDAADTFIAQTLEVTDTASAAGSLLARWRVGGITQFSVSKSGILSLGTAATPSALAATAFNAFASTVSGAVLMGYGTTADVTLKNRAGTDVLKIGPNTTAAVFAGSVTGGAASFTTGTFSGTLRAMGTAGIGGAAVADTGLYIASNALTGTTQYGIISNATFSSAATAAGIGLAAFVTTAAASYTMTDAKGIWILNAGKGAGSTITNLYGLYIDDQTAGGTNYAIYTNAGLVRFGGAATFASTVTIQSIGAFAAGDKYLVVDASGNIHKSALGPAS